MSMVDYEMAERSAKLASEYLKKNEPVPDYILRNLLTSIVYLTINYENFGPNVEMFYQDLNAAYTYGNADELEGFDIGAVYGATQFYKVFLNEVKRINEG